MNALLAQFIPEARDLLEEAGAGMLALERDATSPQAINSVFRAVHTLKGSSGLFDVAPLTRLVHAAEDLLDEVRTGELALNSEIVDRLLESLDLLGRWIDSLEARERLPGDAEATMAERVGALRAWLPKKSPAGAAEVRPAASDAPAWLAEFSEEDRRKAYRAVKGGPLLVWTFDPEEDCFFRGDNPLGMVLQSPGLITFRMFPREPFPAFEALDPLVSLLRFEVLSDIGREALEEHMRYVVERVDARRIDAGALAIAAGSRAKAPVFRDFARLARELIANDDAEALRRAINTLSAMAAPASFQASALRWCGDVLDIGGLAARGDLERLIAAIEAGAMPSAAPAPAPRAPAPASPAPKSALDLKLGRSIAREQIQMLETPADPALSAGRTDSAALVLRNVARSLGLGDLPALDAAMAALADRGDLAPLKAFADGLGESAANAPPPPAPPPPAAPAAAAPATAAGPPDASVDGRGVARVLRIDQSKIDSIMNLVAELIVAKNGLSYLATRAEQVHGSRQVDRKSVV